MSTSTIRRLSLVRRIGRSAGALCVLACLTAGVPVSAAPVVNDGRPVITAAQSNISTHVLEIYGLNFGVRRQSTVLLNTYPLTVSRWSATHITAVLPDAVTPGDYLLVVQLGADQGGPRATFNITIEIGRAHV